jgi:tetratricopeptide (TPR) repeat protein
MTFLMEKMRDTWAGSAARPLPGEDFRPRARRHRGSDAAAAFPYRKSAPSWLRHWILVVLLSLPGLPVWACLDLDFDEENLTLEHLNNSHSVNPGDFFLDKTAGYFQERADHWKAEWEAHGRWRDGSRYAVCLAFLEEYEAALELLLDLDAAQPAQYTIAMNIATVYEQLGQYTEALQWIEKAITLDAGNHAGTERIHRNVLRVEAAGKQATCTSLDLIGHDFGDAPIPQSPLDEKALANLQADIFYLLDQRLYLNVVPEPCAARLLFELGNLNHMASFPTASLMNYDFAEEWGFEGALLEARKASVVGANYTKPAPTYASRFEPDERAARERSRTTAMILIMVGILVLLTVAVLVIIHFGKKYEDKRAQNRPPKDGLDFDELFGGRG